MNPWDALNDITITNPLDPQALRVGSDRVTPNDPRYGELLQRNFNKRFVGKPEYVRLVASTLQVVQAVQEAVSSELRVVARSGGCCLEGFVADPAVQVVIDTSLMTDVSYDAEMGAFAIEPGVTLGEAYRKLFVHCLAGHGLRGHERPA